MKIYKNHKKPVSTLKHEDNTAAIFVRETKKNFLAISNLPLLTERSISQ